jgi:hypothetical protein
MMKIQFDASSVALASALASISSAPVRRPSNDSTLWSHPLMKVFTATAQTCPNMRGKDDAGHWVGVDYFHG